MNTQKPSEFAKFVAQASNAGIALILIFVFSLGPALFRVIAVEGEVEAAHSAAEYKSAKAAEDAAEAAEEKERAARERDELEKQQFETDKTFLNSNCGEIAPLLAEVNSVISNPSLGLAPKRGRLVSISEDLWSFEEIAEKSFIQTSAWSAIHNLRVGLLLSSTKGLNTDAALNERIPELLAPLEGLCEGF